MKELGSAGEKLAENYLVALGYRFVERNFYNKTGYRKGEIDLIFEKDGQLVFVEVKTRVGSRDDGVLPELAVDRNKLDKLNKIIQVYLCKNRLLECSWRLDVISIVFNQANRRANLRHFKSV